jgi:hypothetical protein
MIYKNGYRVVYEVAADGKRTFYATKSNAYPTRDEAGNIIENEMNTLLASFDDADFDGKTVYEYKGEFFVSKGAVPAYKEDGTPADDKITGFDKLFVEEKPTETNEPTPAAEVPGATPEVDEDEPEVEEDEPAAGTDEDEIEADE